MNYIEENNKIILSDFDSFDIEEILECGQCFRFNKIDEKHYKIIAFNKVLNIKQENNKVEFYPCNKKDFENIWINYFDLNTDYMKIKEELSKNDDVLKEAIEYAGGIRILKQDTFECLISFIISQNNRIPMIKKVIENISCKYGNKLEENIYAFPTLEQLLNATNEELKECKTGFRAKYIIDAVEKVKNKTVNIDEFPKLSTEELKENLMQIKGVGIKVADCVILFSNSRMEVFPTDVWVKRVMEYFYFDKYIINIKEIHKLANEKWGNYAGYAQQYLFHYARQKGIGKK